MDPIKSRGSYDATVVDIATTKASRNGLDMLADADEELIKNIFVLGTEFKYTSNEEVVKKASGWLKAVASVTSHVPWGLTVSTITNVATVGVIIAGKDFIVRTNAHLYRLDLNELAATKFYNEYWADGNTITEKKTSFWRVDNF